MIELGQLSKVDLRDVWKTEAQDFTPWLAQAENLNILGEAIHLDLELEAQEKSVGPFRADILCMDTENDSWVLIENQLQRTDHVHLGQLMTYAAGLHAATIVWVAAEFTDEHRAAMDWLNEITDENFRFFGLEVELWCIGDSLAAPKFNVISKPNDWSRSVARGVRSIESQELSETRQLQIEYWQAFQLKVEAKAGPVQATRRPRPRAWMSFKVGRSKFKLGAVMLRRQNNIRAELYISGDDAKRNFHALKQDKTEIEREFGAALAWEELPDGLDSRIAVYLPESDPEDRSDWSRQHDWLADQVNELHRVFHNRVRSLSPDDWADETVAAD